ncbi:hypothetical protein CDG81_18885 [Actinopolyspora erythraea]|uniref:DUF2784 domain-containing protein n=1 Tax=Actinopolyspora erythraea TaxID=414996 RepID=A0A099D8N9_9ACTN|nr:hypothetical protein [Actinopolyspora erythraea]ASU79985.1 hypothetical protein CDG81_18885 [Actinopolyspora erythraea]KGI82291.1 hypothetical protein IL38_06030 [Actinopolyspora erythraea]
MADFASEFATLLLFGTPWLVLGKLLHWLAAGRISLAPRGSRGVKGELVAWLLLATLDCHTAALWSDFTIQPEDKCQRYGFSSNSHVHIDGSSFFDYPVVTRCVWPDGDTKPLVPWELNITTAVLLTAAVAVVVHAAVRTHRHRRAPQHTRQ